MTKWPVPDQSSWSVPTTVCFFSSVSCCTEFTFWFSGLFLKFSKLENYAVVWPETLSFSLSYQSKGWKYKVSPGLEFQSFGKWIHFIELYQLGKFTIVNYQSVKERNWKKLLSMFSLYYLEGKSMSWRDF